MKKLGKKRTIQNESEKKLNETTDKRAEVYVCTPAYDGKVDTDYCQSLAEAAYVSPAFGIHFIQGVMGNGAFIDLARNIFVKYFLEKYPDATHLFFIDADLKFPPNAFVGLVKADLPICAGVYRRRQEPEDYPIHLAEHKDGGLWVEDSFIMANRVPTGFLCIRRDVVEEMVEDALKLDIHGQDGPVPRLFYTENELKDSGEYSFLGEDYAFCDDYVRKYKKPIPVWPNIDFVHGGFEGNYFEFLEKKIEEEELLESA